MFSDIVSASKKGDDIGIATSVLSLVGTVAAFGGPWGAALSAACGLAVTILGFFTEPGPSELEIMGEI